MKISEFQEIIKNIYIRKDKERGVKSSFVWLVEEIGELAEILKNNEIDKNKASEELADIVAWTCSIANILEIDLESCLLEKYPKMCIKCKSNPCICK